MIERVKAWLHKLTQPKAARVVQPVLAWRGVSFKDWQVSGDRIAFARELFNDPRGQDLLMVLFNHIPYDPTPVNPAWSHGRVTGYMECLNLLLVLPSPDRRATDDVGQPTYSAPDNIFYDEEE